MAKIVIAIGGNALGNNIAEHQKLIKFTAKKISKLIQQNHEIIIVHGNGPQVGTINLAFETANQKDSNIFKMSFDECSALSQGYIGYHLQQSINNEIQKLNLNKTIATIITQTIVDEKDPAFKNPTKPIGNFYAENTAKKLAKKNNWVVKSDANRGWRRVIASPIPIDIVEKNIIKELVEKKHLIICGGGGGIPVISTSNKQIKGVEAVIDKDLIAAKIATILKAEQLIILTAVKAVAINFNNPKEEWLKTLTIKDAKKYIDDNQFASGSMLPKIIATINFIKDNPSSLAMIGHLEDLDEIIQQKKGTKIIN